MSGPKATSTPRTCPGCCANLSNEHLWDPNRGLCPTSFNWSDFLALVNFPQELALEFRPGRFIVDGELMRALQAAALFPDKQFVADLTQAGKLDAVVNYLTRMVHRDVVPSPAFYVASEPSKEQLNILEYIVLNTTLFSSGQERIWHALQHIFAEGHLVCARHDLFLTEHKYQNILEHEEHVRQSHLLCRSSPEISAALYGAHSVITEWFKKISNMSRRAFIRGGSRTALDSLSAEEFFAYQFDREKFVTIPSARGSTTEAVKGVFETCLRDFVGTTDYALLRRARRIAVKHRSVARKETRENVRVLRELDLELRPPKDAKLDVPLLEELARRELGLD